MHTLHRLFLVAVLVAAGLPILSQTASAQGIQRESLAGESAADAMRQSDSNQPYNLQLGPVTLRADASLSGAYNDNIDVVKTGRTSDFIITPELDINAKWQATDLNALVFDVGIGYQIYTMHSSNSGLILTPNSNLTFNVFVGDVKLQFFDDFSYEQDPIGVGQLSNVSQFARLQNDAGVQADWDLQDIILSMGYTHTNFWVFESAYNYLDYNEDSLTPKITFKVSPTVDAGLTSAFSSTYYDKNVLGDSTSVSGGPFVTATITDNLSLTAQVGWYFGSYGHSQSSGDQDINGPSASAGINHRINDVLSESLTAGYQYIPGITADFTRRGYVNYNVGWQATKYISVGGNLWWENLDDGNATFRQDSNRYGVGLNLGYAFTDHLSLNLGYQYVLKQADPSVFDYSQDLASIGLRYQF